MGEKFKYKVVEHDAEFDLESDMHGDLSACPEDLISLSEQAAEDYFSNHDGWECSWPLQFDIYIRDELAGSMSVELSNQPVFDASPHNP